jgi:hypothetical protein
MDFLKARAEGREHDSRRFYRLDPAIGSGRRGTGDAP